MLRIILSIACFIVLSNSVNAEDCSNPRLDNATTEECYSKELENVNALLKKKLKQLIKQYKPSASDDEHQTQWSNDMIASIHQTQASWEQYRTDLCNNQVAASVAGGHGGGITMLRCEIKLTHQRLETLEPD
ncbi:MAG: DUF1311 domain-containing protein [Pseudomonadales bacterium]|nr:DUF1311 domain-containing protein [Pseudomonadales bacterium]